MVARVGGAEYRLDDTFWTALRYRAAYGCSFLEHLRDGHAEWALKNIVYIAIDPQKRPGRSEFDRTVDHEIEHIGLMLYGKIWGADKSACGQAKKKAAMEDCDEFHTVCAWGLCGLPVDVLREVTATQAAGIIALYGRLQGGGTGETRYREMTQDEQAEIYGFDYARIETALEAVE